MKFYMTELCREIYWNIGHGAKVLVPMFLVTLPALALVVGAIIERRKIYLQGRPLQRLDRLSDRIDILFRNVMLQRKVVRGSGAGTAHGLFFWGFFLLRSGRINIERVNMVTATGQPVLVSNFPFCLTMFEDGNKGADQEGTLAVKDLAELLVERRI